jgi:hypothetical protein
MPHDFAVTFDLPLPRAVLKRDDTFTDTTTEAVCCGSLLERLSLKYAQA